MASMAVYLRSRPRSFLRPSTPVYSSYSRSNFSSSSSSPPDPSGENSVPTEDTQSNSSSSWNDVRSRLQGGDGQSSPQGPRQGFSSSQDGRPLQNKPTSPLDISEIRKNLSEFNRRTGAPSPPLDFNDSQGPPSFHELYKKMAQNEGQSGVSSDVSPSPRVTLASIRQQLKSKTSVSDKFKRQGPSTFSLSKYKDSFNLKPNEGFNTPGTGSRMIEGMREGLPDSVFGKELREKSMKAEDDNSLVKTYSENDLGEKLKNLRSDGLKKGQDEFSLSELNQRLIKLRQLDLKERESSSSKESRFAELRSTLQQVQNKDSDRKISPHRVGLLGHLGGTPAFLSAPPKENLVEKYFHPDNMSSAQKLKLQLKAVREECKISESDCGSTQVQIAQLTVEITHLSKVLHKKDKHNKRSLLAKVHLRRKLLKYLRRTNWESYCFILTRFGLRDNPGKLR